MLPHINHHFELFLLAYAVLPTLLCRLFHIGVYWRGNQNSDKVSLTFDDGPDPNYTPEILNILKKYNARATFFVVGKHAKNNPQLIARIKAEGHTLGIHGYHHWLAWLLDPISSIKEISKGDQVLKEIIGNHQYLFRPAWGVFNICSLVYLWLSRKKPVLWSFMAKDWENRATPASIFNNVITRIKPGSVIVFHDRCTKPGAAEGGPSKTIQALPKILESIYTIGLQSVPVDELLQLKKDQRLLY